MVDHLRSEMEADGVKTPVHFIDISDNGICLEVNRAHPLHVGQDVYIAVGTVSPNIRGKIRWVKSGEGKKDNLQLGVEFESLLLQPPQHQGEDEMLEAWQGLTQSVSVLESFLYILDSRDMEVTDGQVEDLSGAVYKIIRWMEEHLGPLNLWGALHEIDGGVTIHTLVNRHQHQESDSQHIRGRILQAATTEMGVLEDNRAYLPGERIVLECLDLKEGQSDLAQKLGNLLGRRLTLWTRILMKNIALRVLAEEVERLRE